MDLEEMLVRESVRATIARYNFAGDRGRIAELAECFTERGVLAVEGREPMVGHMGIVAGLSGAVLDPADERVSARTHVHHIVSNVHFISVTSARAEVASYFTVLTPIGLDHWGRYRDAFVPSGGEWLIDDRRVSTDGYAPDSLFR